MTYVRHFVLPARNTYPVNNERRVMERIRDSVSKTFPPLLLHLDELKELVTFVAETCDDVIIETGGYRLNMSDQLTDIPLDASHDLSVRGHNPLISLYLSRVHGTLDVAGGDVTAEGVAARIESILLTGKRYLPTPSFWAGAWVGLPWIATSLYPHILTIIAASAVTLAGIVFTGYGSFMRLYRYNTIVFKPRGECPNFWFRNKDKLILLAIGSVFGILATLAVKAIFG